MKIQYLITGKVHESSTRIAISNIRVEVWDKDLIFDDLVGSTTTDLEGNFSFSFDESYFKELFFDRRPDLFFRLYYNNKLVLDTQNHTLWNLAEKDQTLQLLVDGAKVGLPGSSGATEEIPGLKLDELGSILPLDVAILQKLKEKKLTLDQVGESTLTALVNDKIINPAQKKEIQLTVNLAQLSGENLDLVKALKGVTKESSVELLSWDKNNWLSFLNDKKIKLPVEETTLDSYAENLREVVEKSFPSEYFLHRVVNGNSKSKTSELVSTIAPLFQNNAVIVPTVQDEILSYEWKGIDAKSRQNIESGLAELAPLINSYRALGLVEILNHRDKTAAQKQSAVEQRFGALSTFYSNNIDIQLEYADFSSSDSQTKKDNWNWTGIESVDQPYVKKQMAASQRVFTMAGDHATGNLLMKKGYDSGYAVTSKSEKEFLKDSGLVWETGKKVYAMASEMAVGSSHYYEVIRDISKGDFRNIALSNQAASLVNDLKEIDGYEDFFGNQDYCDCEACKSILSPAAYFTDLMLFVRKHVSEKLFIPSRTTHPLYLKRRRPDLWTLKLSCQNTNTEIPYLQVVNDVLEKYLGHEIPSADIYETLRTADWSCRQPFNLALEETRLYLSHFNISLPEIYKTLQQPKEEQYREQLLLSVEELQLISSPNPAGTHKRFGNIALSNFNLQEFIRLAGITRSQLDDLLATKFAPAIASVKVKMVKTGTDIQQYKEELTGLAEANLDVIHRYLRLWKKTDYTLREFDMILCAMKAKNLFNTLEDMDGGSQPKILQLALIKTIQQQLGLTTEEVATIVYRLPQIALINNQDSLYNRIFDLEKIFGVASIDSNGVKTYNSTAILPFIKANDKITPLILAGLGIMESELQAIFKLLAIDTTADQTIDIDVLSALYRHAAIARGLNLNIENFIHLSELYTGGSAITQLSQIETLIDAASWQKNSPFSISELMLIIKGKESSDLQFVNDIHVVSATVIEIQASAIADKKDKKDVLEAYLLSAFNLTTDQLKNEFFTKLLSLTPGSASITTALDATFTDGKPNTPSELDGLLTLLHEMERYSLLFQKAQFDVEMISFMIANKEIFGIVDLKNIEVDHLSHVLQYHKLLENKDEQRNALNLALQKIQLNGNFSAVENAALAVAWMQPESMITSLSSSISVAMPALSAVNDLQDCLALALVLGLQGDALLKLKKSDKPGLLAARNVVVGAFASKYPDEKTRNEKLESYNDKLNTLKRDALCDYIISRNDKFKFKDRNDLYNFFLLDVEMSGCFRTSYLVAAITSLQLYVHRCLINLEQSDFLLNPSIENVKVIPTWIPSDEWDWRKNYRVWEANRKVFLYPENYIDPTLRDNKTEIFRELEDELLQQKISKDSAEAAYKKYLAQFTELTRLRYAGGYYHNVSDGFGFLGLGNEEMSNNSDVYYLVDGISLGTESTESLFYLFARTNVHPYKYYYRTYNHNKLAWTSWKTIELAIEAGEISSIIYQGKLYIYWTETQSKEVSKISGGDSKSDGFIFKVYVKYSFLDENGKWSPPQRLYMGHNHVDEETIFRRVWKGEFPDAGVREKTHDSTVEKFQELVFRKPYARTNEIITSPISLQHIWSHNKSKSKVKYTTSSITYEANGVQVNIPSVSFEVTNDDFNLAGSKSTIASIIYLGASFTVSVKVTLEDASHCSVFFDIFLFSFSADIPVQHDQLNTPIKTNSRNVSLSRNAITNLSNNDLLHVTGDVSSYLPLQREYNLAFSENEYNSFYIESGKKALSSHFIAQTPYNDSNLFVKNGNKLDTVTLSTILTDELGDILFAKGLEQFLSLTTQKLTDDFGQQLNFKGSYGEYYWELFFHIPFLIADHLNANQKFKEAKWWYERIFNPTADEQPDDIKKTDHNWQFIKFRNLDIEKLKDILANEEAINAYKKDPFNPHAIARLRMNAYQKTIVMHYIDNLLDWGDYLFTQDTRESINEAEMLYQLAFDILGKRPIKVGKCETEDEDNITYANIEEMMIQGKGSEFLIQLENYYWVQKQTYAFEKETMRVSKKLQSIASKKTDSQKSFAVIATKAATTSSREMMKTITDMASSPSVPKTSTDKYAARAKSYKKVQARKNDASENRTKWTDAKEYIYGRNANDKFKTEKNYRTPGHDLVKQYTMAFCVPPNADLMQYWDRVEDRLFKIRNCMNIKGIRRSLSLFQPPIDPMLLVRARAAGLSLEDIAALINSGNNLPAYRFTYLIEKAKQFTQTIQSFGSALLSALEKKDGEELTLLRSVHEKNILKMTKTVKRKQLQDAQYQYKVSDAALTNVQNRVDYYQGLIDTGLTAWEVTEQASKWTASGIKITEATLGFLTSVLGFLPQVGSPFAMKYGGQELNNGTGRLADATGTLAAIADNIAILAGLEASHQRREQDWKQQLKISQQEYKMSSIQLLAADMRQQIAEQDLLIHEKNMEQGDEAFDFNKNKFTNLGLFNYMASTLNRLYRNAYNIAYDLAKQAETAYRFERYDDEIYIQADNWQFDRAGLLSGERLMLQLQQLEKKFIDGNVRQPEITQTFSLAQLSPLQLIQLRQTGKCNIIIPEITFEVLYPGQYRRTIKSVRVTIPCVAGQYTNISARLTLTKGWIEKKDDNVLEELLVAKNTSISSSSANNDSGVFDLNFRDERYLPFESAGAISEWVLELPVNIRAFNYDTISDVLLHISYTALEGNRENAETALSALVDTYSTANGFYRLISLRYEFPDTLYKFFSEDNQQATFELTPAHFPYLLGSKKMVMVADCLLYIKPKKKMKAVANNNVKVNNTTVVWSDSTNIPGGPPSDVKDDRMKGGTIALNNNPVKTWTIDAANKGIDKDSTEDLLILIRYKTTP